MLLPSTARIVTGYDDDLANPEYWDSIGLPLDYPLDPGITDEA